MLRVHLTNEQRAELEVPRRHAVGRVAGRAQWSCSITSPTVTLDQLLRRRTGCGWKDQGFQGARPVPFVTPESIALVRGLPFAVLCRHRTAGAAGVWDRGQLACCASALLYHEHVKHRAS